MPYIIIKQSFIEWTTAPFSLFCIQKDIKNRYEAEEIVHLYVLYYLALDSFSQSELQNQIYIRDIGAGALV